MRLTYHQSLSLCYLPNRGSSSSGMEALEALEAHLSLPLVITLTTMTLDEREGMHVLGKGLIVLSGHLVHMTLHEGQRKARGGARDRG